MKNGLEAGMLLISPEGHKIHYVLDSECPIMKQSMKC